MPRSVLWKIWKIQVSDAEAGPTVPAVQRHRRGLGDLVGLWPPVENCWERDWTGVKLVEINFKLWIYTVPIHPSSTPKLGFTWIYIFTPIYFNQYSLDVFLHEISANMDHHHQAWLRRYSILSASWTNWSWRLVGKVLIYSWDIPSGKLT